MRAGEGWQKGGGKTYGHLESLPPRHSWAQIKKGKCGEGICEPGRETGIG